MPYKVYAALHEDINSGWVWLGGFECEQRSIIKLKHKTNDKSVYCEALIIDENYISKYQSGNTSPIENINNTIIANEWYRQKLGIQNKKADENIEISTQNNLIGRFMASIQHPQVVVRLATWLSVISLLLGILGVILGYQSK